jgi:hypothetical protein
VSSSHLTQPTPTKGAAMRPARKVGRQAPGQCGPDSALQVYVPPAPAVTARAARPARPNPSTPDEARMATKRLPGPAPRKASIRVTNKAQRPKSLTATGGPQLGRPGITGSRKSA